MKKVNLLSKAEMKKVMGGNAPVDGEDCIHECICADGTKKEAKVSNCDKDTCDNSGTSAFCKVGGVMTTQSCGTVCQ